MLDEAESVREEFDRARVVSRRPHRTAIALRGWANLAQSIASPVPGKGRPTCPAKDTNTKTPAAPWRRRSLQVQFDGFRYALLADFVKRLIVRAAAFRGITLSVQPVNHAHGFANCFISVCTAPSIAIRARLRYVRIIDLKC